jgi:hypothetical protein
VGGARPELVAHGVDEFTVGGAVDGNEPFADRRDKLSAALDEPRKSDTLEERTLVDAVLDHIRDPSVEAVEEKLEAAQHARLHDRVGRKRPQATDSVRSFGRGGSA